MTALDIYLWQQADSIQSFFAPFSFFGIAIGAIGTIITAVLSHWTHEIEKEAVIALKRTRRVTTIVLVIGVLSYTASCFLPSSKTIAMMVALPAIANSEPIQKDLPELYQLAKDALKEQIAGKK